MNMPPARFILFANYGLALYNSLIAASIGGSDLTLWFLHMLLCAVNVFCVFIMEAAIGRE